MMPCVNQLEFAIHCEKMKERVRLPDRLQDIETEKQRDEESAEREKLVHQKTRRLVDRDTQTGGKTESEWQGEILY